MPIRPRHKNPSGRPPAASSPSLVERLERRILFAIDVTLGTGSPSQALVFTDADGTVARVRVSGGTATITFDGNPVGQSTSGRLTTVTGTGVTMTNMVLSGASPGVAVRTSGGGDGSVTLGGLSAAGPVRGIAAPGVVLTGPATLSNGIGRLTLGGARDATLTINRSGQALLQDASVSILSVTDAAITSQQPMRQLRVGSWGLGNENQSNTITTTRINVLQCAGDFNAGLALSGNGQVVGQPVLGNAKVVGALASGAWDVAGKTGRVAAGSVGSGWNGTFGDLSSFSTPGDFAGSISANTINSLSAGSLTNAGIDVTRAFATGATALNHLNVRGAIAGTRVRSGADIGSVSAASITGSSVFAGVANGGGGGAAVAARRRQRVRVPRHDQERDHPDPRHALLRRQQHRRLDARPDQRGNHPGRQRRRRLRPGGADDSVPERPAQRHRRNPPRGRPHRPVGHDHRGGFPGAGLLTSAMAPPCFACMRMRSSSMTHISPLRRLSSFVMHQFPTMRS